MRERLAEHFYRDEFACQCGCGFNTVDILLLQLVVEIRSFEEASVEVGCGCRCPTHNDEVGGTKDTSQHLFARAGDLYVKDAVKTYQWLCEQYPDRYGFGLYWWGIHVDSRTNGPARWNRRT